MSSPTIDPDVLALFSERGQSLLSSATRRHPAKDRETIRRKLTACRRPTYEAVFEFEEYFGGLTLGPQHRPLELGVLFEEPDPDPDDPDDPERTMVPIGRFPRGSTRLFMDQRGEVVSYFEGIEMRSQSIFSYLEQLAIDYDDRWPEPRFRVSIRPPMGEQLASALRLHRLDAESWDSTPGVLRLHYGQQEEQITGTIWIFEPEEEPTVQQYRQDRGKLIGWDTYTTRGGVGRDAE